MQRQWFARLAGIARASPGELALIAVLGFTLIGGSALVFVRNTDPAPPPLRKVSEPKPSAEAAKKIFVHVAGLVKNPGVFELPEGSRVKDAIDAAGGAQDGADLEALNLAAKLADGEKILVTPPGQAPQVAPVGGQGLPVPGAQPAKLNLNTATAAQLEELPNIGPVLAERIATHRQTKGSFTSVKQLMEVSGVGPKKFEGLKDLVTV